MLCRRHTRAALLLLSFVGVTTPAHAEAAAALASKAPLVAEPIAEASPLVVRRSAPALGVEVQMMVLAAPGADERETAAHLDAAFAELARISTLLDATRADSDVARMNQAAGTDAVVVAPEVFALLTEAKRVASLSRGAFDPTGAPLDAAWSFTGSSPAGNGEAPASPEPPSDEDLASRRSLVDHKDLILDAAARTAALKKPEQAVSLDGIAKGFALERAASVLEERGVKNFVLAAGGDMVVRGAHGDRPWRVGIQDPRAAGHFAATTVKGGAVMTTGDYERFFKDGDTRYHHVLDPSTGKPATGTRSVTVFADDAATADALSTAVFVLGPKQGLALIGRLKGVEAVVVTADNRVLVSAGLKKDLTWRPPTDAP